jgi:hypothetical protein
MFPFQRHPLRAGQGREAVLPAPCVMLVEPPATGPAHIVVGTAPPTIGPRADGADRISRRRRARALAWGADAAEIAAVQLPFPAARAEAHRLGRLGGQRLARRRRRPADERLHPEHIPPRQWIDPRWLTDEPGVMQAHHQRSPGPDNGLLGTAQAGGIHFATPVYPQ